jgi:DNA polymerase III delta prime subunit
MLKDVTWNNNPFQQLVDAEKHQIILKSLVNDHSRASGMAQSDSTWKPDPMIVRGKAQGLITLLHGPPGTGKTCTADW